MTDDQNVPSESSQASAPEELPGLRVPIETDPDRIVEQLHEEFLASEPGQFFRARALQLMHEVPAASGPPWPWPEGTFADEVRSYLSDDDSLEVSAHPDQLRLLDGFMLAQHLGECLLRHSISIVSRQHTNPPRPIWLNMVALQGGKAFRDRVKLLREDNALLLEQIVETLFVPPEVAEHLGGPTELSKMKMFCREWLIYFANAFLAKGNGYNAAKHGLSPIGSRVEWTYVQINDPATGEAVTPTAETLMDGLAITTLEHSPGGKPENWVWSRVTRAVDPAAMVAITLIGADLLDWMWTIERLRHREQGLYLRPRKSPLPQQVLGVHPLRWKTLEAPLAPLALGGDARAEALAKIDEAIGTAERSD